MESYFLNGIRIIFFFASLSSMSADGLGRSEIGHFDNNFYQLRLIYLARGGMEAADAVSIVGLKTTNNYVFPDGLFLGGPGKSLPNLWSLDGEYVVLPRRPFEGFYLLKSETLVGSSKAISSSSFIQVQMTNQTGLFHEFISWENGHVLKFRAGLSGDWFYFWHEPGSDKVFTDDSNPQDFVAITPSGVKPVAFWATNEGASKKNH